MKKKKIKAPEQQPVVIQSYITRHPADKSKRRVDSFINNDGEMVHALFILEETGWQHNGTYATLHEAQTITPLQIRKNNKLVD